MKNGRVTSGLYEIVVFDQPQCFFFISEKSLVIYIRSNVLTWSSGTLRNGLTTGRQHEILLFSKVPSIYIVIEK